MSSIALDLEHRDPLPVALQEVSRQKILDYLTAFGLAKELTEPEKNQFIEIACEFRLNPFKREIYCIPFNNQDGKRLSIIVGYEVYIKRAERTGRLDGWKAWIEGQGEDLKAVVEIYRKDWSHAFIHETYWKEVAQRKRDGSLTQFWNKQPRFQLKKVAISQAFRLCFPDELGGIPYDPSELPLEQGDLPDITPRDQEEPLPQATIGIPPPTVSRPIPDSEPIEQTVLPSQRNPPIATSPNVRTPAFVPFHTHGVTLMDPKIIKDRILTLVDDSPEQFNEKHRSWILDKSDTAQGLEELRRLLGYVEKVIRQARHPDNPI